MGISRFKGVKSDTVRRLKIKIVRRNRILYVFFYSIFFEEEVSIIGTEPGDVDYFLKTMLFVFVTNKVIFFKKKKKEERLVCFLQCLCVEALNKQDALDKLLSYTV